MNKETKVAEILCVGTELLLGDIVNTNAAFLSKKLAELGICVYHHSVVGDNPKRLKDAFALALSRADIVVTSGGLGPTKDDLTKETAAEFFGRDMYLDEKSLADIKAYFAATGRVMSQNNEKQAMMPEGAIVFENRYGTAPALAIEGGEGNSKTVIMLPGPPVELVPLFNEEVEPYLRKKNEAAIVSRNIHFFGIGESALAQKLDTLLSEATNPSVAPYCNSGEVRLRVTASDESETVAAQMCDECVSEILKSEVGSLVYGVDVDTIENALVIKLKEKGLTLSCAESCTGGLIAKRVTDIPGTSEVFLGGCVTYTNEIKQKLLGVSAKTLQKHTAVSAEVAMEMARGVRDRTGSDIALSTTGIAGPTGGSELTPVGTVFLGISTRDGESFRKLSLSSRRSREFIRTVSATNAFDMALKYIAERQN